MWRMQAYGRIGRFEEAENLFGSLANADGVAITTMLTLYESMGKEKEALALSQSVLDPAVPVDARTLNQLLIKHAKAGW